MALNYSLNDGGTSYSVVNNSCTSGAVIIPSTYNGLPVTRIGTYAFVGCTSLTSVTIPDSVTSIGDGAFSDCTSLTSIIIPNSVTSIEGGVFTGCTSLTSITLVDGLPAIGFLWFEGIPITSITIPNSVTSIESYAFSYCTSLTRVNLLGNAPTLGTDVFLNTNANLKIYRQNLTAGWTSTFGGKPVFILSSNIIKGDGTGKLTTKKRN